MGISIIEIGESNFCINQNARLFCVNNRSHEEPSSMLAKMSEAADREKMIISGALASDAIAEAKVINSTKTGNFKR